MEQFNSEDSIPSNEHDRLKFLVTRYDGYYDSINNKSTVYLGINTFLTGGIIAFFTTKNPIFSCWSFPIVCISICGFMGLSSLIILAILSIPHLDTKSNSLIFFGSIVKKGLSQFESESKQYTLTDELQDLRNQVFCLAEGLKKKFRRLSIVGWLLTTQFILIVPILLTLLKSI